MSTQKKHMVVLGAGESGVGTAILAQKQGYTVFVSDFGAVKPHYASVLQKHNIPFEEKGHTTSEILSASIVMKSPGIPNKAPIVKAIREKGIEVVSEIEFAANFTNATLIAITGSNGKTTTTSMVYDILKKDGQNVGLAGNIGQSFAWQVATEHYDFYVLEISSFQLDDTKHFHPHISVLTNITPDHLDQYNYQFENYITSKFKITANQKASDYFIYCADDEVITNYMKANHISATCLPFSIQKEMAEGGFATNETLTINLKKKLLTCQSTN